mmetsp:Transcript_64226/g.147894  ORF Transcript_64226/g.147894 Transcript_64226/m.147894 type:complete len:219 (+) Transcript_64226:113-769(+)
MSCAIAVRVKNTFVDVCDESESRPLRRTLSSPCMLCVSDESREPCRKAVTLDETSTDAGSSGSSTPRSAVEQGASVEIGICLFDLLQREEPRNCKHDSWRESKVTTMVLRNIPNKYTLHMLCAEFHDKGFAQTIDFVYLPLDGANGVNKGYAFLNFRTTDAACQFDTVFSGAPLRCFRSQKVAKVEKASVQGYKAHRKILRSKLAKNVEVGASWFAQV